MPVVEPLLRPLPAVVPCAVVEIDEPESLHFDAERLHLPGPAAYDRLMGNASTEVTVKRLALGLVAGAAGAAVA